MFFILLTFAAALSIEGLGSLVSVIGISALFGANPIIIALAIALDVGKIVVVSLLYTYWRQLGVLMKSYALMAATVTMIITSAGAAGYLSGEFQKAIMGAKEGDLKVNVLKEQAARYQERKKQIDDQIANLPQRTSVNQRLRLINGFKSEQQKLDAQIAEIDKQLPELQVSQIGTEAKVGPILQIAKAFDVPVEQAVKWVILMIIFVFDPLAIFLIIAGNFLWAKRKQKIEEEEDEYDDWAPTPEQTKNAYDPEYVASKQEEPVTFVDVSPPEDVAPPPIEPPFVPNPPKEPPKPTVPVMSDEALKINPEVVEIIPQTGLTRPIEVDAPSPAPREVAHSTLVDVPADPTTIVDAHNDLGWRKSTVTK